MRNYLTAVISLLLMAAVSACNDDDDVPYPSIVTHFANVKADDNGELSQLILDDGTAYTITNILSGYTKGHTYRGVCGYTIDDTIAKRITLYQAEPVHVLADSTTAPKADPTSVSSVWATQKYINLQLQPKTQSRKQYWGYITDSITSHCAYLTLYHNQNSDPMAYSTTVYASLPLDSIAADSIHLRINTFSGVRTWKLKRKG